MKVSKQTIEGLLKIHSPFWHQQLQVHPEDLDWLLNEVDLDHPRSIKNLQTHWKHFSWPRLSVKESFANLRSVKRREMLRITVRELTHSASLQEIVFELSTLADFCLQQSLPPILREMENKYNKPEATFAVIGMGKLGGQELNYSSDIDLIFVYSDEGNLGRISYHDFFSRVAEELVRGFRYNESDGSLFRVDLRLRPEGNSGPITRSLESYETYYAAFGEVWERMALQKARLVAGDQELGYEFNQHLQPFCFPKHLPTTALDEIFHIKTRIENEILKDGGLERHVKLGRGGIREIEFSVQALQLLHGSRNAFSQERGTLKSLQALHRLDLLSVKDVTELTEAYVFLRRLEHRLQMREDRQTHIVPADKETQTLIALGLGYESHKAFEKEWKRHIEFVRAFFHGIVRPNVGEKTTAVSFEWNKSSEQRDKALKKAGFTDLDHSGTIFHTLANGPEYAHVSERTRKLFDQLAPRILEIAPRLVRQDFVLQQFERFIEGYGSRAALYELLTSNPKILELLFELFDHSRFLTNLIVHQPTLLESIAFEGLLTTTHERKRMEVQLSEEIGETPEIRLRRFRSYELLRIGLRDILGVSPSIEETCEEISCLADVCLKEALRICTDRLVLQTKGTKSSNFCVIALGKYGSQELSYGSDLDVLFIGGSAEQATKLIHVMSQELSDGIVFKIDARLRPDGKDGPLTIPFSAYENYYETRAQFWELQALTRARVVAGNEELGSKFMKLVSKLIYSHSISSKELKQIDEMRERIRKERGDSNDPIRDFKTGSGGLVDIEFFVQAHQLLWGYQHEELRGTSSFQVLRLLPKIKTKEQPFKKLLEDYCWLRRLEAILRAFDNNSVSQLPASREQWEPIAKHLGLANASTLEKELMAHRKLIAETVNAYFKSNPK